MQIDQKEERIRQLEAALVESRDYLAKLPIVPVTLGMIKRMDAVLSQNSFAPVVKMMGERRGNGGAVLIMNLQVIGDTAYVQSNIPHHKAERLWEVMQQGFTIRLQRQQEMDVTAVGEFNTLRTKDSASSVDRAMSTLRTEEGK